MYNFNYMWCKVIKKILVGALEEDHILAISILQVQIKLQLLKPQSRNY
ncbi:hypothetical protein Ccrd_012039 [Cynara cardunculus var. scolymus]|uniref:Uncharacterized protein n=1 Tax=Cynara cardunculus var. scolymus TaxID=59895 RepID=A0A103YIC2_CYNCS|nr:hypothetical protein Ccrd_012039 [Cynara cardunculus var. scolymus]